MANEPTQTAKAAAPPVRTVQQSKPDTEIVEERAHPGTAVGKARFDPRALTPRDMRQLHGSLGNQAVGRLLRTSPATGGAAAVLQRQPASPAGVQIRAGSMAPDTIARDDAPAAQTTPPGGWGTDYKSKKSRIKESYDTYKGTIGHNDKRPEVKAASEWGGTGIHVKTTVTEDQLRRIVDAAGEPPTTARIAPMAGGMSASFATMGIDTAQAQALYIAHMTGETGGVLEETGGDQRWYAPFQGRGPVQVTHEYNYVQTLAYVETRADQLDEEIKKKEARIAELEAQKASPPATPGATAPPDPQKEIDALTAEVATLKKQVKDLREAHAAVKADQKQASNPKYAFLFSAAFMHMTGAVRASSKVGKTAPFTGKGSEDSWVTGGNVQDVPQADGSVKHQGMTFEERKAYAIAHGDKQLETDMTSAIDRGSKKSKVYGRAVSILGTENKI